MAARRSSWRFPVVAFVIWRLVQGVTLVAMGGSALPSLSEWDGEWFARVLRHGYVPVRGSYQPTAFFPLLPWTTRGVQFVVRSELLAATLVTSVAALGAVAAVYGITRRWRGEPTARVAVVVLLVFPTSLYLWQFYSEGLFVALSAGALLAQERGRPALAGAVAAGAALTRLPAVLLVAALLAGHLQRRRRLEQSMLWYGLGVVGLAPLMVAQALQAGSGLAFASAGRAWGRQPSSPWRPIATAVGAFVRGQAAGYLGLPLDLLAAFLLLAAVVLIFRRTWPWSARTLLATSVAVLLCSGLLTSMSRYALTAWPAFPVAADHLLVAPRRVKVVLLVASLFLSLFVLRAWADRTFVA